MEKINLNHHPKLKKDNKKLFSLNIAKKIVLLLILILIFEFFLFPAPILASEFINEANIALNSENLENIDFTDTTKEIKEAQNEFEIVNNLPTNEDIEIIRSSYHTVSAYNSEVSQCDGAPCITANGFNLCEHGIEDSVAANWLKFGTKIKIPELFGDRVFVVRDRMNKKYPDRLDVWLKDKEESKKFGVRIAKIEILGEP